jgi:small subunit ribosomal protein S20
LANIKSQKKRNKTNQKSHQRNVQVKSHLKTSVRKVRTAAVNQDRQSAADQMKNVIRKLDVAVRKGVIHANQAKQRKSKLQKQVNLLASKG